jgi:hypothetical protein
MARREVVEVKCDRCKKVETQNKDEIASSSNITAPPEFTLHYGQKSVTYQDLCRGCRKAVGNYVKKLAMEDEDEKAPEKPKVEEKPKGGLSGLLGKHS